MLGVEQALQPGSPLTEWQNGLGTLLRTVSENPENAAASKMLRDLSNPYPTAAWTELLAVILGGGYSFELERALWSVGECPLPTEELVDAIALNPQYLVPLLAAIRRNIQRRRFQRRSRLCWQRRRPCELKRLPGSRRQQSSRSSRQSNSSK